MRSYRLERNGGIASEMIYEEFRPFGAAADRVESYWRFRADEARDPDHISHRIVPDGLTGIVGAFFGETLVQLLVTGPSTKAVSIDLVKGARAAGIRLRPGHTRALLGLAPGDLRDRSAPLAVTAPDACDWATAALAGIWRDEAIPHLDRTMAALHASGDDLVRAAGDRILESSGQVIIADLAHAAGLGERQFRDRFTREAGIGPKALARVRRQRAAWISIVIGEAANLSDASHEAGYADQAHFSRAARQAFGLRPGGVRDYVTTISHRFYWREQG